MSPVATLSLIAPLLRVQLDRRLLAAGEGSLEETVTWLSENGVYSDERALRDYARRLAPRSAAAAFDLAESLGLNDLAVLKLRLQCCEIAATAGGDDLFGTADQVMAYAVRPLAEVQS